MKEFGFDGIIAKRKDSCYESGKRSGAWLKYKVNPNPTFFHTGSAREPYNHGQWGSALRATPQATVGDVTDGQGLQTTCTFTCPWFPASLASLTDW